MIAYKLGNGLPPLSGKSTLAEKRFYDLNYDRRDDVTVVFRIVEIDPDGCDDHSLETHRPEKSSQAKICKRRALDGFQGTIMDLTNKTALVTGGTKGIGFAIAEALAKAGANVFVCSRTREEVEEAVGKLG